MNIWIIISGAAILFVCIFLIVVVLLQESKQSGFSSSFSGTAPSETFLNKGGGRTKQAQLKRLTKIAAVVFFILVFALYALDRILV